LPDFDESRFYVVKSDWFWNQVADGYAPEEDFLFKDVSLQLLFFLNSLSKWQ
jgi:hypothetical protein